jgi:hypothetical protein
MPKKFFNIVLGFLLILAGIFYFFRDYIDVSFCAVGSLIIGIAFMWLYFNTRRTWAVLPGIYLLYLGIASTFLSGFEIYSYILTSVFFFAPGSIFLLLYYSGRQSSPLLTFGLLLTSLGVCVILTGLFDFTYINIFLLCIGIGFVVNYILGKSYDNKTPLIVGVILILLSLRKLLNLSGYTDMIISLLLVIAGLVIIIKALPKKRED